MKILWFSNSPCGSIRRNSNKPIIGGWLISLEAAIKKIDNIELSVAYFSDIAESDFVYEGVHYFPIYRNGHKNNHLLRILSRLSNLNKSDEKDKILLMDVVEKVKPDLIHIHGTEKSYGLLSLTNTKIPIVFSIQGLISSYLEKRYSGIPENYLKKNNSLRDHLTFTTEQFNINNWEHNANREISYLVKAKYILGRTFWDRDITLLFNKSRTYYQCEEILRSPFYSYKWDKKRTNGKFVIASTVSSGIYKGLETLLKAANALKKYTDIDFEWRVIGVNPNDRTFRIAQKYVKLNYQDINVKLLGRKDADDVVRVLLDTDVYCHVSHIENSPNSVCEAMILGLPIVATYAGGTASILENGKEGILVQDGDPYIMAGSIIDLYINEESARLFGKNARERALIRHNPQTIANSLFKIYQEIEADNK